MANGFFLGGVQDGLNSGRASILQRDKFNTQKDQFSRRFDFDKNIEGNKRSEQADANLRQVVSDSSSLIGRTLNSEAKRKALELSTNAISRAFSTSFVAKNQRSPTQLEVEEGTFSLLGNLGLSVNQEEQGSFDQNQAIQQQSRVNQLENQQRVQQINQGTRANPADSNDSVNSKKIENFISRGFSLNDATDLAGGNVVLSSDPETKLPTLVNKVTGEVRQTRNFNETPQVDELTEVDGESFNRVPLDDNQDTTAFQDVAATGAGVSLLIRSMFGKAPLVGQFFLNKELNQGIKSYELWRDDAVKAVIRDGKITNAKLKSAEKLIPSISNIFESPERIEQELLVLKRRFEGDLEEDKGIAQDKNTSSKERIRALGSIERIESVLRKLGVSEVNPNLMSDEQLDAEITRLEAVQ